MDDRTRDRHGRRAESPTEIPARGWKDVLARVKQESKDDHLSLLAAGTAFYGLLAMVPAMVAAVSVYGLVAEPAQIDQQVRSALGAAPREVREMIREQLQSIASGSKSGAWVALILGVLVALWSAASGMNHLVEALNSAYDEEETRGFVKLRLTSLSLTVGALVFAAFAIGVIAVLPPLIGKWELGVAGRVGVEAARWILLGLAMTVALSVLYRLAPDRQDAKWRWVSVGAVVATVLWLLSSVLFSIYTANFGRYNETYGTLGAAVIIMLWLMITAATILLGAELNCELERQTVRDTTTGPPQPLGQRQAYAADTVGGTAEAVRASDDIPADEGSGRQGTPALQPVATSTRSAFDGRSFLGGLTVALVLGGMLRRRRH